MTVACDPSEPSNDLAVPPAVTATQKDLLGQDTDTNSPPMFSDWPQVPAGPATAESGAAVSPTSISPADPTSFMQ
jgi:hypothetical protein